MNDGHGIIASLLESLRQVKGPHGRIRIHACHWLPDKPEARGIIAAGTGAAGRWDGALRIGESVEFAGTAPRPGHLHLFDLGTSGTCIKLMPSKEFPDNLVQAGEEFRIPSELRLAAERLPGGAFRVVGPASAECGKPERLLAIITQDDADLQIEDLHPKLRGRDLLTRCAARGPAFTGPPRVDTAKLFRIPPERWDCGVLELEVVP